MGTEVSVDISSMVQAVNQALADGEPGNVSVEDFSNQTYTGYKPQFIIDALNQMVGWGNWGFNELSNEIVGEKGTLVVSQVQVFFKGCDFQPTGWGQSRIITGNIGDAKKGAQTDAFKKALSYFSIGNKAYQGLLEAPPKEDRNTRPPQRSSNNASANRPALPAQPVTNTPPAEGQATEQQLESIRKLCQALKKQVPDGIKTNEQAKQLIGQLSQEYRQSRTKVASGAGGGK